VWRWADAANRSTWRNKTTRKDAVKAAVDLIGQGMALVTITDENGFWGARIAGNYWYPLVDLFAPLVDFVHKPAQITGQFQRRLVFWSEFVPDGLLHNSTQDRRFLGFGTNRPVTFESPPRSTALYQRRKGTDQELVEFERVKSPPYRWAGWGLETPAWLFLCSRIFSLW
jgi:hypothetical protein